MMVLDTSFTKEFGLLKDQSENQKMSELQQSQSTPSMLLFGPQAALPSESILAELGDELRQNAHLSKFRDAISDSPGIWQNLLEFDPELSQIDGRGYLCGLGKWAKEGGSFPYQTTESPNVFTFPVNFIFQVVQYIRFLRSLSLKDAQRHTLERFRDGGVHGFCVGFLTAITVSASQNESEIGSLAAKLLHLAVAIGAYVDLDIHVAQELDKVACVSVRWKEKKGREVLHDLVRSHPNAYISSTTDEKTVSITAPASDILALSKEFKSHSFYVKDIPVQGRFHSEAHSSIVERLVKLYSQPGELQIPSVKDLQAVVRSTVDGKIINSGSLVRHALENTLLKPVEWYKMLQAGLEEMPQGQKTIGLAGWSTPMPSSLLQKFDIQTFNLQNIQISRPLEPFVRVGEESCSKTSTQAARLPADLPSHSIAIVGVAGKFPEADSLDELWDIIKDGKSMVQKAPVERLGLDFLTGDHSQKTWWGNFLRNAECFDHKFFKKSSREVQAWDPQQRILLEVVYQALESSGYFGPKAKAEPKDYGCYIGAVMNNYYDNVSCHPPTAYATVGTSRCYISGIMSHYFGWTGPSLSIDTACSSSLVAINTACRAIWSGECSRAVAGGTNVITSPFDYQNLNAAGFLSPSGQCKPFDAKGDGYCRGEGVGVVVLKSLSDALRENDEILGVITGSAANQNYNDSHITVPHSQSQVELYRKVMDMAGVSPDEVTYVEAHGTGTGVGDPVESRSIREAFGGPSRQSTLHLSSIKGNIGHTEATAGIAGLIKVLLMMEHGQIPPQASHQSLNPKIPPFEPDRMAIPRELTPWKTAKRIACVNSYGAAGSNSAVLIHGMPTELSKPKTQKLSEASKLPLFLSAASASSLKAQCQTLLAWLNRLRSNGNTEFCLSDVLFNINGRGNHALQYGISGSVSDISDLESKLSAATVSDLPSPKRVVLVFGGQESPYVGLSQEIYQSSLIFRHHLDECQSVLTELGYEGIFPDIFQQTPISTLTTLHSALFASQYASAKAWMDSGLQVDAVVGHSFGQLTALCVSGVLGLRDALKLVAGRASLMQEHWGYEPGSMMFIRAERRKSEEIIGELENELDYAEIACYNGPNSHVVVGSEKAVEKIENFVAKNHQTIRTKKLNVTNGFHSKYTEPLLPHLSALAEELEWKTPTIHLETCTEEPASGQLDHRLIAEHTRQPVFFHQAIDRLAKAYGETAWIEVGVGSSVTQLVRESLPQKEGHTLFPAKLGTANALTSLVDTTIEMWNLGISVQYWPFHRSQRSQYQYLSLPLYQFEKTPHWLPFIGRSAGKETATLPSTTESLETPEFLSLTKGDGKTSASFQISPKSDRFQALCGAHVMSGQVLAPASLYFEVAARAALLLQGDSEAKDWIPSTEKLSMNSPIGLNEDIKIVMTLKRTDKSQPSWSFNITTQMPAGAGGRFSEPMCHSTGNVHLKRRDNAEVAQQFKRYETLTGYRRFSTITDDPEAERMQGKHVYRAFNHIVHYAEAFQGIKSIACVDMEAAGIVRITPDQSDPTDQRLTDTPMTDSFMQFAGFLVNYFNNPDFEDTLFVCHKIDHIEIGPGFSPDTKEWFVCSTMTDEGNDHSTSDAYVFDAETKKMVFAAFGFHFSKTSRAVLARILGGVNKSSTPTTKVKESVTKEAPGNPIELQPTAPLKVSSSKRADLFQILSTVTDIPVEDLKDGSSLSDLGIDSLGATEVLNDIRTTLGLTIDLSSFLFFPDLKAIVAHVDEQLGLGGDEVVEIQNSESSSGTLTPDSEATLSPTTELGGLLKSEEKGEFVSRPTIVSAYDCFNDIRLDYDRLADAASCLNYYSDVYPGQARLVQAYVVEAFAKLGCDLRRISRGQQIPVITGYLPRHKQLVRQLHRVLEDGKLIQQAADGFIRTEVAVDTASAQQVYDEISTNHPEHATVNHLVRAIGSELAECLKGDKDGLQITFGNRKNKKALEDFYQNWPLFSMPTILLGDFLRKAFTNFDGTGKFKVLEIGAGTGGTTRHLVNMLKNHGLPFEYHFTDISSSLINEAKKTFKDVDGMTFGVLDVEKAPQDEFKNAFHVIIATNCIHATRNLKTSLNHIRMMLREDGALTLVEITRNIFFFDIIVGLFEGWWLFEDDRTHALVDENHWQRVMRDAGFREVAWTDGDSRESSTVRVVAAFPKAEKVVETTPVKAVIKETPYKKLGDKPVYADVYCPVNADPAKPLPVALMIHGGSHIIFSRKDIRPAQTRLLLSMGFLPVSLDHRLCPEAKLAEGPMVDVCDALSWARNELPAVDLGNPSLKVDGGRVVVVGWSSGGQLAMSLAWTAPQRGLKPPDAILAFYCPTNYEDEWWQSPIQPIGAEDKGDDYDLLEAIQDEPITNYGVVGAWEPLSDPRIRTDPRCRIVLHINWKAQTLPIIIGGLPSKPKAATERPEITDWKALPQPPLEEIKRCSALAQVKKGNYNTPTFLVHGTADDLIPWQQSQGTYEAMKQSGIPVELALIEGAPHICDLSSDPASEGWKVVVKGYEFLNRYV